MSNFLDQTAEELVDRAWEEETPITRRRLALEALGICPDALDAYVILGLVLPTDIERIVMLREGVRRGKILWNAEMKRPADHYFWRDIRTRPFMRACQNLALLLWENNECSEAVELVTMLYRLNKNDNQGMRYLLLAWMPVLGEWSKFERVLKRCAREGRADYLYGACLNAYRNEDDHRNLLFAAVHANRFVPAFLSDTRLRPSDSANQHLETQAFEYARLNRDAWSCVPNATNWLKREAVKLGQTGTRAN